MLINILTWAFHWSVLTPNPQTLKLFTLVLGQTIWTAHLLSFLDQLIKPCMSTSRAEPLLLNPKDRSCPLHSYDWYGGFKYLWFLLSGRLGEPSLGRPGRPWSLLDFSNWAAISKPVRQWSVGQTNQKLQAIWSYLDLIHDGAPVDMCNSRVSSHIFMLSTIMPLEFLIFLELWLSKGIESWCQNINK